MDTWPGRWALQATCRVIGAFDEPVSSSTPPSPAPSETAAAQRRPVRRATAIILGVVAVQVLVLTILVTKNGAYGYFSDEFYHIACSERLAWGYVDHPPLTVALLALIRAVFGDAVWAMRLGPILATAGVIVLTGLMARRLGAGTFGQGLATLAAAVTPWYLIPASTWTLNSFDTLSWALGAYVIIGILKSENPKGWLVFGIVAGLGLLTKLSMGYLLIGLFVALLLTPNRKYFASIVDGKFRPGWHLWGGVVLAILIFLPHIVWQVQNGWPTIEFARGSARSSKPGARPVSTLTPIAFMAARSTSAGSRNAPSPKFGRSGNYSFCLDRYI